MTNYILNACLNPLPAPPKAKRTKRSIGVGGELWTTGQTLLISFFGNPPDALKHAIFDVAEQWTDYANLLFKLVDDRFGCSHQDQNRRTRGSEPKLPW